MAVKIRISRVGTTNAPIFRVIAIDSRRKRDGKALEILGTYNPCKDEFIKFESDRINYWLSQGAIPTDSVKKLQKRYKRLKQDKAA